MGRKWLCEHVGGCCGTTPEHIKAFADAMQGIAPRKLPKIKTAMRLSGLEPLNIDDESLFVNVGERNKRDWFGEIQTLN